MVEVPPPFDVPGFPKTWFLRHANEETLPPPKGWASWAEYDDYVLKGDGVTTYASPGTVPRGSKMSLVFTRVGEDVAVIGMHFVKVDGSEVVDFGGAEQAAIEGFAGDMWTALKPKYDPSIALDRAIWHDFGVGIRKPNPQSREHAFGTVAGTGGADLQLPPQVAVSVTFKTSHRRQWGRVYMPAPIGGQNIAGRLTSPDDYRTAFGDFADSCLAANTPLVVWSPRHGGAPLEFGKAEHLANLDEPDSTSFARTVDQIQVDDLFDVIESRRYDKPIVRETHTLVP